MNDRIENTYTRSGRIANPTEQVEWKKMWEVTAWDKKFQGVEKYMQKRIIAYKYLLAKDLFALSVPNGNIKLLSTGVQEGWTTEELAGNLVSEGEVVTIPWGKSPGAQNPVKYYKGKFVTGDNRIATSLDTNLLSNKFLYYWMYSKSNTIETFYRGAGIQHPSMFKVLNMAIPIPSIEEQNRIVGILDTFTDSIENLKQQIAQRRKQYEHYLLKILKGFDSEVLEYLADFRYGYTANSSEDGFFRIIRITDIDASGRLLYNDKKYIIDDNKCRDYILNKGDLVVARTGASFGKTLYFQDDEPSVFASFLIQIIPNNKKLDNKYYWHFSRSPIYWNQANALVSKGGQQQFNTGAIKKIKVPLPPLPEQQRIVSILDTFEASITNLEAQLEQRQKQYEYYRNQLLTFE